MPRKKTDTATQGKATSAKDKDAAPKKDTITVSVEVTPQQYRQLQTVAAMCGYGSDEAGIDTLMTS